MTDVIRRELRFSQPPEVVWRALTDKAVLGEWMYPNDFEPRLGHRFTFRVPSHWEKFDGVVRCEVLECVPPTTLAFSWVGGGVDTRVSYRLQAEGSGTLVLFEHAGAFSRPALRGAELGWPLMHAQLGKLLAAKEQT
jgi:uncharacterized protein YndB with AHSA1/START domain